MNVELKQFKGLHAGKRGWLVCPGPSLDALDWGLIGPADIVLACNQAPIGLPRWDYAFATDGAVTEMSRYPEFVHNAGIAFIHASDGWLTQPKFLERKSLMAPEDVDKLWVMTRDYEAGKAVWSLNTDAYKLIEGEDVSQPAAHLLAVMGCTPIILAGVDCCYLGHQKYCRARHGAPWAYDNVAAGRTVSEWTDPGGFKISSMPGGYDDGAMNGACNAWVKVRNANPGLDIRLAQDFGRLVGVFPVGLT